jgi:hypothetical protein
MSNSLYGVAYKMLQPAVIVGLYLSVFYWLSHRILLSVTLGVFTFAIHSFSQVCLTHYENWKSYLRNEKKEA